jgi:hypothetical protein
MHIIIVKCISAMSSDVIIENDDASNIRMDARGKVQIWNPRHLGTFSAPQHLLGTSAPSRHLSTFSAPQHLLGTFKCNLALGTCTYPLARDRLNCEKNSTLKDDGLQTNLTNVCTDDVFCHTLRNNNVSTTV